MREAYAASSKTAKSGGIQNGSGISEMDTVSTIHEQITAIFRRLQPLKTWALIADTLGLKEHAAKHRAANHRDYTVEELQTLLHGDDGAEVLELLMADAEPAWWRALRATLELSRARVAQAEWQQKILALDAAPLDQPARRKLKKVNDADRAFNKVRAEKELATGFLHQNVDRPVDRVMVTPAAKTKIPAAGMRAGGRR